MARGGIGEQGAEGEVLGPEGERRPGTWAGRVSRRGRKQDQQDQEGSRL